MPLLALAALVTGSRVYCVLTIIAAMRYRAVRPEATGKRMLAKGPACPSVF
ncbi:MAG: hypothetical protein LAQ69_37040 [Acidobacteriia bacterium]|nr:hypothetical protein [Terriglobia bacterium]